MTVIEHLELPIPPLGNHRNGFRWSDNRHYPTEETKKYRRLVQLTCIGMTPLEGLVGTRVQIHRRPEQRGDLDGYLKCLFDHLEGFAWVDDKQIHFLELTILEDGGDNPHVDVWFWEYGVPLGKSVELEKDKRPKKGRVSLKPNTCRPKREGSHGKK